MTMYTTIKSTDVQSFTFMYVNNVREGVYRVQFSDCAALLVHD